MFFVNKLNPPASQSGGQLYDFSWVNNNGVSIGGNTFFPPFPLTPRIDTLAHAIMHNLGLDHTTYGAGPYEPESATNPFPPAGFCRRSRLPRCWGSVMRDTPLAWPI